MRRKKRFFVLKAVSRDSQLKNRLEKTIRKNDPMSGKTSDLRAD